MAADCPEQSWCSSPVQILSPGAWTTLEPPRQRLPHPCWFCKGGYLESILRGQLDFHGRDPRHSKTRRRGNRHTPACFGQLDAAKENHSPTVTSALAIHSQSIPSLPQHKEHSSGHANAIQPKSWH